MERNMRVRKIGFLFFLSFFFCLTSNQKASAQYSQGGDIHYNLPNFDNKSMHYGFFLAGNYSNYRLTLSDYAVNNNQNITGVSSVGQTSFTLGFVVNKRINDFLDLRLLPSVAFYFRNVEFYYQGQDEPEIQASEASMIEFPLLLKYKSVRRKNSRMYMVAGIKPSIEVGAKKKQKSEDDLRTKSMDVSLEIGFGLDNYFELFKFAPEIRFSYGLVNMKNNDENEFAYSIDRMNTYAVTFSLFFE